MLIFLVSIIPITALNASAAENVCCAKSGDNYCVFTTEDKCDSSSQVKSSLGFTSSPFSCSQLADCKPVCCVNQNGVCSEKISKAQCRNQVGKPIDSPDCKIPECEKGACVIANQCQYPVTSGACKTEAEKQKVKYIFDNSVTSQQECSTKYSLEEGCCVSNTCLRTTGEKCTLSKGTFFPGKLCSNQDLVGQCRDHSKDYSTTCNKDGNLYHIDSRGVLENMVGIPNDGLIHNKQSDIINQQGYCDFSKGFSCGKNKDGQYACIDINCKAGNVIDLTGIVQYQPFTGKMFPEQHTIKQEDLGGVQERKNGESWCITPPETGSERENKQNHYTFSCQLGKIRVEICSLSGFRNKVCLQDTKEGKPFAKCVDNRWEDCWLYGGGNSFTDSQAFYPENRAESKYEDEQECLFLGGSLDPAKSHCTLKTGGKNECLPKYPPGFQFWKSAAQDTANAQRLCSTRCGQGGNARTNSCDETECLALGDCGNFKQGLPWWGGAGIGAAVGFFSGAGMNNLFNVGQGGGFLGGAASSTASQAAVNTISFEVAHGATQAVAIEAGKTAAIQAGATAGEALKASTAAYAKISAGVAKIAPQVIGAAKTVPPAIAKEAAKQTLKSTTTGVLKTVSKEVIIGTAVTQITKLGIDKQTDRTPETGDREIYQKDGKYYEVVGKDLLEIDYTSERYNQEVREANK